MNTQVVCEESPPRRLFQLENRIMQSIVILSPVEAQRSVEAAQLLSLVSAFLETKGRSCSQRTIENYTHDLQPFVEWWQANAPAYAYILTENLFRNFISWLDRDYRNPFDRQSTSHTKWRTTKRVRQVLRWGFERGIINANICEMCPQYPDDGRLKYFPDLEDIAAMLHAAQGEIRLRDAAIVAFAASTGARRFEIANARVEHLAFDSPMSCLETGAAHGGHVRFYKVKGDRDGRGYGRISAFDTHAGLLLKAYLLSVNRKQGLIFGLTDVGIRNVIVRLGAQSDIPDMHPHAFRSALVDYWADYHRDRSYMATVAMKLQVGHAMDRKDVSLAYIDTRNERKVLSLIRHFHVSPLMAIPWNWQLWPVHSTPADVPARTVAAVCG